MADEEDDLDQDDGEDYPFLHFREHGWQEHVDPETAGDTRRLIEALDRNQRQLRDLVREKRCQQAPLEVFDRLAPILQPHLDRIEQGHGGAHIDAWGAADRSDPVVALAGQLAELRQQVSVLAIRQASQEMTLQVLGTCLDHLSTEGDHAPGQRKAALPAPWVRGFRAWRWCTSMRRTRLTPPWPLPPRPTQPAPDRAEPTPAPLRTGSSRPWRPTRGTAPGQRAMALADASMAHRQAHLEATRLETEHAANEAGRPQGRHQPRARRESMQRLAGKGEGQWESHQSPQAPGRTEGIPTRTRAPRLNCSRQESHQDHRAGLARWYSSIWSTWRRSGPRGSTPPG